MDQKGILQYLMFKSRKLATGLLLHTALNILLTIHCCFWEQVIKKVKRFQKGLLGLEKVENGTCGLRADQYYIFIYIYIYICLYIYISVVGTEPGDFARPSETSRNFVCNTRPMALGLKQGNFPQRKTFLKLQRQVKQQKRTAVKSTIWCTFI